MFTPYLCLRPPRKSGWEWTPCKSMNCTEKCTQMKHINKYKHCKCNATGLKKAHADMDADVDMLADQCKHTVRRFMVASEMKSSFILFSFV